MSTNDKITKIESYSQLFAFSVLVILATVPIIFNPLGRFSESVPFGVVEFSIASVVLAVLVLTVCFLYVDVFIETALNKKLSDLAKVPLYVTVISLGVTTLVGWVNLKQYQNSPDEIFGDLDMVGPKFMNLALGGFLAVGTMCCGFGLGRMAKKFLSTNETPEERLESDLLTWTKEKESFFKTLDDTSQVYDLEQRQLFTEKINSKVHDAISSYDMRHDISREVWSFAAVQNRLSKTVAKELQGNHNWPENSYEKIFEYIKQSTLTHEFLSAYREEYLNEIFSNSGTHIEGHIVLRIIRMYDDDPTREELYSLRNKGQLLVQEITSKSALPRDDRRKMREPQFLLKIKMVLSFIYAQHYQLQNSGFLDFTTHTQKRGLLIDAFTLIKKEIISESPSKVSFESFFENNLDFEIQLDPITTKHRLDTILRFMSRYNSSLYLPLEESNKEHTFEIKSLVETLTRSFSEE
ncbi:hypothetical protein OAV04_00545 [Candidatus Poseidoniaceae archaeon]|nr:hypothetical protein [Candidatus Poseidoniaceae archaeon]